MPELSQFISNNKKIAAIVTRVISGKLLDILLARVIVFLEENENYGVIFAGLTDNQASLQLHLISEMSNVGSRILLLEQIPSHTVGDIFRNSNFSIWTGVSIGMYHSLSCGCPVVLMRNRGSAEHLIHTGINGMWYDDLDGIPVALTSADSKEWNRKKIANSVRHANSNEYFSNILKELKCEV
jgi:glycosyltransferase involved in cell wall biosynthesis